MMKDDDAKHAADPAGRTGHPARAGRAAFLRGFASVVAYAAPAMLALQELGCSGGSGPLPGEGTSVGTSPTQATSCSSATESVSASSSSASSATESESASSSSC